MRNNLFKILNSLNVNFNSHVLSRIIDRPQLRGNTCFFLFNVQSDKCVYLCPSISEILGHCHRKYLDKSFLFFIKIIHPLDISNLIEEILTLIKLAENRDKTLISINNSGISLRIKHRNGSWLKSKVYLIYLREKDLCNKILLGFIKRDINGFKGQTVNTVLVTPREKEIFEYLSCGNSAKIIADKLCISENTVITHRKNLIIKLNVKNTAELIKKGFEMNIPNFPMP